MAWNRSNGEQQEQPGIMWWYELLLLLLLRYRDRERARRRSWLSTPTVEVTPSSASGLPRTFELLAMPSPSSLLATSLRIRWRSLRFLDSRWVRQGLSDPWFSILCDLKRKPKFCIFNMPIVFPRSSPLDGFWKKNSSSPPDAKNGRNYGT